MKKLQIILFSGILFFHTHPLIAKDVPMYKVFEDSVSNAKTYANKVSDVILTTQFVSPSNKIVNFWGFYDGDGKGSQSGNIWKFRFMPDESGTWTYSYSWSDGTPGSSGSFNCITDGAGKGILKPYTKNKRWLAYNAKEPVMYRSYYVGKMTHTPLDWSIQHVYQPLVNHGYNAIQFLGTISEFMDHCWLDAPSHSTTACGSGSTHNFTAWKLAEEHFNWLNDHNISVHHWTGFGWNWDKLSSKEKEVHIRYIMARLAAYANQAGWGYWYEQQAPDDFMDLLKKYDPWDHLRGGQNLHENTSFNQPKYTWINQANYHEFFIPQTLHRYVTDKFTKISPYMPYNMNENVMWHGEYHTTDADLLRKLAWGCTTAGGLFVWNWASTELWEGTNDFKYSNELFDASNADEYLDIMYNIMDHDLTNFALTNPHDELLSNVSDTAWCLAEPGKQYLVCNIHGGSFDLELDSGLYTGHWVDLKTNSKQLVDTVKGGRIVSFIAPGTTTDWALVLNVVIVPVAKLSLK